MSASTVPRRHAESLELNHQDRNTAPPELRSELKGEMEVVINPAKEPTTGEKRKRDANEDDHASSRSSSQTTQPFHHTPSSSPNYFSLEDFNKRWETDYLSLRSHQNLNRILYSCGFGAYGSPIEDPPEEECFPYEVHAEVLQAKLKHTRLFTDLHGVYPVKFESQDCEPFSEINLAQAHEDEKASKAGYLRAIRHRMRVKALTGHEMAWPKPKEWWAFRGSDMTRGEFEEIQDEIEQDMHVAAGDWEAYHGKEKPEDRAIMGWRA
ncbi:Hypothetical predicted protein [Lecanosticta acicola]|uniref:Uncharacterized protein n=1 Tax=Lecanosticta acicola TaxID=111012 RepID=A0AAI8YYJ9_9PEZI|nr:Hypothetical predicted protein [Lecanosticta acicola]